MTNSESGLVTGADGVDRCWWGSEPDIYRTYHDTEWGRPVADDQRLFEKLCLEGFQSGLSWLIILRKREGFREAFCDFDFRKVARFTNRTIDRLVLETRIVRHRGKIASTVNNAQRASEIINEFGSLAAYFWQWEPHDDERPTTFDRATLQSLGKTARSISLSKDLRKRGWSYVGPTTIYAFMQAMGMVNDHLAGCHCRAACTLARTKFPRPAPP